MPSTQRMLASCGPTHTYDFLGNCISKKEITHLNLANMKFIIDSQIYEAIE